MVSLLALLILHSFFINQLCSGTDTITQNMILRDGDTLVSDGGVYALGFFSPGNSKLRYVGIWYHKITEQTVVWVANRNHPVNDSSSGVLKIDGRRNLAIFNVNAADPVWSTNISIPIGGSSTVCKLLDSGNLVVIEENRGGILWQSFDHPTNTLLPGMKVGLSFKSGLNWSFTSWKSRDDPSMGDFVLSLDRTESPEIFLKRGPTLIWRTGPWNGQSWSGVPLMMHYLIFKYTFVNNPDEISFSFSVHNSSILSRIFMDDLGFIQRWNWVEATRRWNNVWSAPADGCDNYGKCGLYGRCNSNSDMICSCLPGFEPKSQRNWNSLDRTEGCARKRELLCGKGDGFLKLSNVKVPDTSKSNARVNMSLGIKDCEIECRNNCSCTGYASADINGGGGGCLAWFGDLIDIREYTDGGQDFYLRVDAIELENSRRIHSKASFKSKKLVLSSVLSVVGLLLFISALCYLFKAKLRGYLQAKRLQTPPFNLSNLETNEEANANFELPSLDLDTVIVATENFSPTNKLGSGGFGSVYKGKLLDGREIAVKRLSKNSGQGVNEFKNEILLIAKLQHRNLVQILGCCVEKEEKMLVYEYMPNKSLDFLIFDQARNMSLDWRTRYDIIIGIARGVLYLHQDSRLKIIHRDLKASNILLDAKMNPRISDFGMARIFGGDQSQANTKRVVGTYGYMSPEYAMDGQFSIKSDVFSFGVLLLEVISGRRNTGFYHEDPSMNLIKHAWELWKDGRILDLVDPSIGNSFPQEEVVRFIQVGILCVQENAKDRPTMSGVIFMLGNERPIPPLKQPAFVLIRTFHSADASASSHSHNEMSISIVEGR